MNNNKTNYIISYLTLGIACTCLILNCILFSILYKQNKKIYELNDINKEILNTETDANLDIASETDCIATELNATETDATNTDATETDAEDTTEEKVEPSDDEIVVVPYNNTTETYATTEYVAPIIYDEPVQPEGTDNKLTAYGGVNYYDGHKETYYNLNMSQVVANAQAQGIEGEYWVREDGVKMYGDYVIVAANLNSHPRGSLVETSLGTGIVLDTGGFASYNSEQYDIATDW